LEYGSIENLLLVGRASSPFGSLARAAAVPALDERDANASLDIRYSKFRCGVKQ
jgi:hypothetical protein